MPDRFHILPALAVIAMLLSAGGCGQMGERFGYEFQRDADGKLTLVSVQPGDRIEQAVSSPNPDERREAVIWMSQPARCSTDTVVRLLSAVLREDPDPTVRSAAAVALGKSINPAAVDPLLAALDDKNDFVRIDAVRALRGKRHDNAKRALLVRLTADANAQARAASAETLRDYPDRRVVEALIAALRDADFAVVYNAEQSLIVLTGHTHEYDADAWRRWLAGLGPEGDPFARAGQTPPQLQPPGRPMGQRMRDRFRQMWYWWQADEKRD